MDSVITETSSVIELGIDAETVQRVRFAVSPAQELFHAVQVAAEPARRPDLAGWSTGAAASLAVSEVGELVAALRGETYAPDFLTPPPGDGDVTLGEQLAQAAATPVEQVAEELALAFRGRRRPPTLDGDAAAARDLLVTQLAACWDPLLGSVWPRVSSILATDIAHRAVRYATGGVAAVLASLHPTVDLDGRVLRVGGTHPDPMTTLDERGLVLLPTVFGPTDLVGPVLIGFWQPSLVYPARGRGLFGLPSGQPSDALAELLGPTRARILAVLVDPQTTTRLHAALGLSASAVSEHLHALHRMGLCDRVRSGRAVVYRATERGERLLLLCAGAR